MHGYVILKRYIDDYFAFLLSKCISGERLLTIANGLNDNINFTLELPNQNQLPFLDTMVSFNPESKTVSTKLHIKPIYTVVVSHPGTVTDPSLLSAQFSLAKPSGQLHVQPIPLHVENHCVNLQIFLLIMGILRNLLKPQLETP